MKKEKGKAKVPMIRGQYANAEYFFQYNLGYDPKTWKRSKTIYFKKTGIFNKETLTEYDMFKLLTAISDSSSKQKNVAKSILKDNFNDFNEEEFKEVEYRVEETDSEIIELCTKYGITYEDFQDRLNICRRKVDSSGMNIAEVINEKKSIIKFKGDLIVLDAIEEYFFG